MLARSRKQLVNCQPKTAVAYARYSSAGQRDVSIEQQLNDIRSFAEREGYTLVAEYADRAKSGFKNVSARHAFQQMMEDASKGAFDTVIAWKVDRFGRNRKDSAIYKSQLAEDGVRVVYAMDPIPDGAAGVLTEGMLEAIAEWYSRNLSENVKRGLNDNARKGISNGRVVMGYRRGPDGRYEINEAEAPAVRRIFALYAEGYSQKRILDMLNREGVLTNLGHPFNQNRIYSILCNEAYIGIYHWNEIRIPGAIPPIIDEITWEKCVMMRKKKNRHFVASPVDFLLTGKCFCGQCGALMAGDSGTSKTGVKYYYYSCRNKKIHHTCSKKSPKKDDLENQVIDFVLDHILAGPSLSALADSVLFSLKKMQDSSPLEKMKQDLKETQKKIENINRAIAEGIWDASTGALLKSLSDQAEAMKKQISVQEYASKNVLSHERIMFFLDKMAHGDRNDLHYRQQLINTFVNSVTVFDDHLRLVVNMTENVELVPLDRLPDLSRLPAASNNAEKFDYYSDASAHYITVEPFPVAVFRIGL